MYTYVARMHVYTAANALCMGVAVLCSSDSAEELTPLDSYSIQ